MKTPNWCESHTRWQGLSDFSSCLSSQELAALLQIYNILLPPQPAKQCNAKETKPN